MFKRRKKRISPLATIEVEQCLKAEKTLLMIKERRKKYIIIIINDFEAETLI